MITPFTIYLITRLDGLTIFLNIITVILFGLAISFFIIMMSDHTIDIKKFSKYIYSFMSTGLIALVINGAIPSSKEVILMYGIPAAINAASNNKQVTRLPDNILKFVNTWLEKETIENHNININK